MSMADSISMNKIKIHLPWPDPDLSPNARVGWRAKAIATAQAREDGGWAAKVDAPPLDDYKKFGKLKAQYIFHPPNRRRRDQDNAAAMMKAYQDGVCDVLEINDYYFQMEKPIWLDPIPGGKVILELEEINE